MNLKKTIFFIIVIISLIISVSAETFITSGVNNTAKTTSSISNVVSGSGSSGSSGSMGVLTNEPYSNIECSNRIEYDWQFDSSITYQFRNCDEFDAIITPKENENDVMLKLEILKDKSINTLSAPSGPIYKYFNLYSGSKRFETATIKFRVDNTWLSNVVSLNLMRWNGNEWTTLETKLLHSDGTYTYYEAYTNAFSNFAIVGTPKVAEVITPVVTTPQPTPIPTTIINETVEIPEEKSIIINYIIFAFVIIGVILIIGYIIYKNIDKEINDKKKKK